MNKKSSTTGASLILPRNLAVQAAGGSPAPRGPGILPGAFKPKLIRYPHSSAARVLVLGMILAHVASVSADTASEAGHGVIWFNKPAAETNPTGECELRYGKKPKNLAVPRGESREFARNEN